MSGKRGEEQRMRLMVNDDDAEQTEALLRLISQVLFASNGRSLKNFE